MNRSEFIEQSKLLTAEAAIINDCIAELQNQYIDENRNFKIGQLVHVVTPKLIHRQIIEGTVVDSPRSKEITVEAFVAGWEISFNQNVVPILFKVKKDGTQSQHRLKLGERDEVRPIKKKENL